MKPLSLLLLLSSLLLSSHLRLAAGRPRALPGWLVDEGGHVQAQRLEELLRRVSGVDGSSSSSSSSSSGGADLLHETTVKLLHSGLHPDEDARSAAVTQLLKRSENPQLSIDLTFDMMRDMLHMAEMERLAMENVNIFDKVGKK